MSVGRVYELSPGRAALLPAAFAAGMLALAWALRGVPTVALSTAGAGVFLLLWTAVLWWRAGQDARPLELRVVLRKPHYVQAIAQALLFTWWVLYVPGIRAFPPLVLAQLLFAYGVSTLIAWTNRGWHELGFGPIPITFSINFFLLFKPEWFYWQFAIVALGYLAKEYIRWEREGRSAHVFNPSSFPLAVFSLFLILTGSTDKTLGLEIATSLFNPPYIHLVIFLVSLPGQLLFGVATMTISAVLTTVLWGLAFYHLTGTYYFYDAYVPIAVFLGMHLLFTDPSTSPRSERGRIVFGILYALGTIAAAGILDAVGAPTFYDKLLPIPLVNLTVRWIDRLFAGGALDRVDLSWIIDRMTPLRQRLVSTGVWIAAFAVLFFTGIVGDEHEGQWIPFWNEACMSGSERACEYLAKVEQNFCEEGSPWSCNELGILIATREGDARRAAIAFRRGCELGLEAACANEERARAGVLAGLQHGELLPADLPIVLRGSKGPIRERDPQKLYALACARGFESACGGREFVG